MAITLTLAQFAAAIRAGDGTNEPTGAERIAIEGTFEAVKAIVDRVAPTAPAAVANEAVVRAGGYLYDAPEGQAGDFLTRSGARSLLKEFTQRSLQFGSVSTPDGGDTPTPTPTPGTGGLTEAQIRALIESYGYQTESGVIADVTAADFATDADVLRLIGDLGYLTTDEVNALIDAREQNFNAYGYYAAIPLTAMNVTTDQAIAATGAGYIHTLVDEYEAHAGIIAGADFITEWEGDFVMEFANAANVEIILRTKHKIGADEKELVHERTLHEDLTRGARLTVPMNVFNSRSRVSAGTYGGVTITEADIAAASKITYEIEIRTSPRRLTARNANTLEYLVSENLETVSYQLGRLTTLSDGEVLEVLNRYNYRTQAQINDLITAFNYLNQGQVRALTDGIIRDELVRRGYQNEAQVRALITGFGYLTDTEARNEGFIRTQDLESLGIYKRESLIYYVAALGSNDLPTDLSAFTSTRVDNKNLFNDNLTYDTTALSIGDDDYFLWAFPADVEIIDIQIPGTLYPLSGFAELGTVSNFKVYSSNFPGQYQNVSITWRWGK